MSELPVIQPPCPHQPIRPSAIPDRSAPSDSVTVDCDHCLVRGPEACGDCVVSVLLGGPPQGVRIDPEEHRALEALASCGLVPPLRLVTAGGHHQVDSP